MAYMESGITWVPSYLIDISDRDKAVITMKATLINDLEDLEDVEVSLVVGTPNFKYAFAHSGLALDQTVVQFLQSLYSSASTGRRSYYSAMTNIAQQVAMPGMSMDDSSMGSYLDPNYVPDTAGGFQEDLFFYKKEKVTLKKGERGDFQIFSALTDYDHIYTLDLPVTIRQRNSYNPPSDPNAAKNKIWHCLKLKNNSKYPWTTGPAMVVKNNKPISQDKMYYTAIGLDSYLKLTVANDIKADEKETEVEREQNVKVNYSRYDLVTVEGEIYLNNRKSESVQMEITKHILGEVLDVSSKGKVDKITMGLKSINPNSVIKWDIRLAPREEKKLTFKYRVYI